MLGTTDVSRDPLAETVRLNCFWSRAANRQREHALHAQSPRLALSEAALSVSEAWEPNVSVHEDRSSPSERKPLPLCHL